MIGKKKILGLVLARKNSKGLKNKNIKKIKGKEIFFWPLNSFKKSKYIDIYTISTDSEIILRKSKENKIPIYFRRPSKLAKDNTPSYEPIIHAINYFKKKRILFDYIVLLEPTSPLTSAKDLDKAIEMVYKKKAKSLVSLGEINQLDPNYFFKISKGVLKKFKSQKLNTRRQDLKKLYYLDGSIYISEVSHYIKNRSFISSKTIPLIFPKFKNFEIDDITDFQIVKFLAEKNRL